VGFWGTFAVVRAELDVARMTALTAGRHALELEKHRPWQPGWQVWRVWGDSTDDLAPKLAAATGAPALAASVMDSSSAHCIGFGPQTGPWEAWLDLESALAYIVTPPSPWDDDGNYLDDAAEDPTYLAKVDSARRELLAAAPGGLAGASQAVAWAREANLAPAPADRIADLLGAEDTFAESLFFNLLELLGVADPS
jgi:hypothetical protein